MVDRVTRRLRARSPSWSLSASVLVAWALAGERVGAADHAERIAVASEALRASGHAPGQVVRKLGAWPQGLPS